MSSRNALSPKHYLSIVIISSAVALICFFLSYKTSEQLHEVASHQRQIKVLQTNKQQPVYTKSDSIGYLD
jgi:hypothetical protein